MAIGLYGPEYLQFDDGGPAREIRIFVFLPGTKDKAVLYADKFGLHTAANPTWTDRRGELVFYAEVGSYDLYYEFPEQAGGYTVPITIPPEDLVGTGEYVHTQSTPSLSWTVNHNLGVRPNVIVEESTLISDDITYPAIRHVDVNTAELRWGYLASGRVTCRR